MSVLTGNTVGSLKKMWPPVKRKAIDANESFGKFLGLAGATAAGETTASTVPKLATGGKKRKATSPDEEADEANDDSAEPAPADTTSDDNKSDSKKKAGPTEKKASTAKKPGRPRKQIKKEGNDDEVMADSGEQSADGGDGVGEYAFIQNVCKWLNDADGECTDKDVTNGV